MDNFCISFVCQGVCYCDTPLNFAMQLHLIKFERYETN
nr:MAG TPA: hypothetical protein [Caudoviricetes sp.]